MKRVTITDARALIERAMRASGQGAEDAALIADHLIDCELRGVTYGGLPRALSIVERLQRTGSSRRAIAIERETPVSARIDGADRIGYAVAHQATRIAIQKAKASGIAIVTARDTWYTGMLSYYAEMATAEGLVAMIASNASPWVAPHGASEGRLGTNPICFAFPSADEPVIWDVGTSAIMHAEVMLAKRLGHDLPRGVAFDAHGAATVDPAAALTGAFAAWGGHKGSGLAIVVQMLGALSGSPFIPPDLADFGFLIVALDPGLLTPADEYKKGVAEFAHAVRSARPVEDGAPVRMPFDRSRAERQRRLQANSIDVADDVYARLAEVGGGLAGA